MRESLKRLSLCIAVLMVALAGLTFGVFAEDLQETEAVYTYQTVDGGLELSSYTGTETQVTIPAELDGLPVVNIGAGLFSGDTALESVTIPEGLKAIGHNAFEDCVNLTRVVIPSSIEVIGEDAFTGDSNLTIQTSEGSYTAVYAEQNAIPTELSVAEISNDVPTENQETAQASAAGPLVDDIELEPDELTLHAGTSFTLQVYIEPFNAANKTLTWSSTNPAVATVSGDGTITAVAPGRCDIIAMATDGSYEDAECEVTVISGGGGGEVNVPVRDVNVYPSDLTLNIGDSYTLNATVVPNNATNKTLSWRSTNPAVATVSDTGVVTAVSAGRAEIIATSTDGTNEDDDCEVTVTGSSANVPVRDVNVYPSDLTLGVGESYTLNATVVPANATNKTLSWRSTNPAVATVSDTGVVTAVSAGRAEIIAASTDGTNEDDDCEVTVTGSSANVPVRDVNVSPSDLTLSVGDSYTLNATVIPNNATNKTLSWRSTNPAVATVSDTGVVTAVSAGRAEIIATSTDGTNEDDDCEVTVVGSSAPSNVPVRDVNVTPSDLTLGVGESYTLNATVIPANATNKTLSWRSTNPAVATVSDTGVVTAVSAGRAEIIATSTDGTNEDDDCEVTVTGSSAPSNVPVRDIDIEPDDMALNIGATFTLRAIIEPANATNKALSWNSSDPNVATVDGSGTVTAVSAGTAIVTATATDGSNVSDACRVVVGQGSGQPGYVPVDDVEVEPDHLNLTVGQTYTLRGYVEPANATNQSISWSSSNGSVASVDAGGTVTAVGAGSANVIATADDGLISDYCVVNVQGPSQPQPGPGPAEPFTIEAANPGEFTVRVTGQPADTQSVTVFAWSTSDQSDLRSVQGEPQNGGWACTVPVDSNTNPIVDADNITVHVYASTQADSVGTILGGRRYSWMDAASVAGKAVAYTAHVQNIGFVPVVYDGETAGTTGQALRLEGIRVSSAIEGVSINAAVHVQDIGWMAPVGDGVYAGTTGQAKRLESVVLTLSGPYSDNYQLRYRVHQQNIGWTDWVSQDQQAGVTGQSLQLEAIEIQLVGK